MTDQSDQTNKALNLVSAKVDLSHLTKEFTAMRLATFDSSAMRAIEEQSKRHQELMASISGRISATAAAQMEMLKVGRIAEEALAQLSQVGGQATKVALEFASANNFANRYAELFRNPMQGELEKIASAARLGATANSFALYQSKAAELRNIAESIHSPWVNNENVLASFQGLVGLTSIGKALRESSHPFEKMATHLLRDQLGDWRHSHSGTVSDGTIERADYYSQQGLNSDLVDYPSSSFDEVLSATLIRPDEVEPVTPKYSLALEITFDVEDVPVHAVEAFKIIVALENRLRRLIDEAMTKQFGPGWVKQRVHEDIRKGWAEKRTRALDSGHKEHPLICYADFTDYEQVIVRKDNWNDVFKTIFHNKESVIESFRRLYPLRISTMHSRIILSEDMLYLMVEARRLMTAINQYYGTRKIN